MRNLIDYISNLLGTYISYDIYIAKSKGGGRSVFFFILVLSYYLYTSSIAFLYIYHACFIHVP